MSAPRPTTLPTLAAELRALGLEVTPSPEGTWLRVAGRFGARVDAEPPGLTAWLDGSRLGWMARFDSAETPARAKRPSHGGVRPGSALRAVRRRSR